MADAREEQRRAWTHRLAVLDAQLGVTSAPVDLEPLWAERAETLDLLDQLDREAD